ncbi:MAG: phage tail tape measure protein, partial [Phycisphaerales bacterium]|nr:phage tail tape measure protein [Phycisphaerales bacterium]
MKFDAGPLRNLGTHARMIADAANTIASLNNSLRGLGDRLGGEMKTAAEATKKATAGIKESLQDVQAAAERGGRVGGRGGQKGGGGRYTVDPSSSGSATRNYFVRRYAVPSSYMDENSMKANRMPRPYRDASGGGSYNPMQIMSVLLHSRVTQPLERKLESIRTALVEAKAATGNDNLTKAHTDAPVSTAVKGSFSTLESVISRLEETIRRAQLGAGRGAIPPPLAPPNREALIAEMVSVIKGSAVANRQQAGDFSERVAIARTDVSKAQDRLRRAGGETDPSILKQRRYDASRITQERDRENREFPQRRAAAQLFELLRSHGMASISGQGRQRSLGGLTQHMKMPEVRSAFQEAYPMDDGPYDLFVRKIGKHFKTNKYIDPEAYIKSINDHAAKLAEELHAGTEKIIESGLGEASAVVAQEMAKAAKTARNKVEKTSDRKIHGSGSKVAQMANREMQRQAQRRKEELPPLDLAKLITLDNEEAAELVEARVKELEGSTGAEAVQARELAQHLVTLVRQHGPKAALGQFKSLMQKGRSSAASLPPNSSSSFLSGSSPNFSSSSSAFSIPAPDGRGGRQGPQPAASRFKNAFERVVLWGGAGTAIYGGVNALQKGVKVMTDFEETMNRVRKVANPLGMDFKFMGDAAKKMAQEYGASILEVAQAMEIYAQQGRAQSDILTQTRVAMLAANVTNLDMVSATEALTA